MKQIKVKLTGTSPILLVADTLVDPTHPLVKKIASLVGGKRTSSMTIEQLLDKARLEWEGGLY